LIGTAVDGIGPIQRIEVSMVGTDEWYPLFPADGVFDQPREQIDADISAVVGTGTGILCVRVYDKAGNSVIRNLPVR
jgi:hypothetical protein